MKVAYVTPRYGGEVTGGAEYAARMLAERLAQRGWEIEAFSSRAVDPVTWENALPAGSAEVDGVTVHRFDAEPRHRDFDRLSRQILHNPRWASPADQERWIRLQGPHSPALLDALPESDADLFVFYPYLFEPTAKGLPRVADRAVFHPAAHDEAPLRLPIFRPVFQGARALVFQTEGERRLVQRLFHTAATPQLLLGLGVEPAEGDPAAARDVLGVGDRPFILYVGRVDHGKGTGTLAAFFHRYKRRRPGPLALVLAGQVVHRPREEGADVIVAGPVDDATKWGALRAAWLFSMPSGYEAFSLATVEAWVAGTPVLVNGRCAATRENCERSRGGLWFESYPEFEAILDRLLADEALRSALGARGKAYVDAHFRWPALMDRYARFLESVASRRR